MHLARIPLGLAVLLAGCGSSDPSTNALPASDASDVGLPPSDAGADGRDDSSTLDTAPPIPFPALTPDLPRLVKRASVVLPSPTFVTVTYSDNTNVDRLEAFADQLGDSAYWRETTSEYGISPAKSGPANHVRLTDEPPARIGLRGEADDETVLMTALVHSGKLPTPEGAVYVIYVSPKTKNVSAIGLPHHASANIDGKSIRYAIIPAGSADRTQDVAHELVEVATDPDLGHGYAYLDRTLMAWNTLFGGATEAADLCQWEPTAEYQDKEPGFEFYVQRSWSNAAADANHYPCVPAPATPFFNVTVPDSVKGITIAAGESQVVELYGYSFAARTDWNLHVVEGNAMIDGLWTDVGHLHLDLDVDQLNNGVVAHLTIGVKAAGNYHTELVTVVSSTAEEKHFYPILVLTP